MIRLSISAILFAIFLHVSPQPTFADPGHPIAVTTSATGVAVETMGGFRILIDAQAESKIRIQELSDLSTTEFQPAHEIDQTPATKTLFHVIRQPNELKSKLIGGPLDPSTSPNALEIAQIKSANGDWIFTRVTADSITIVDLGKSSLSSPLIEALPPADVVVANQCLNVDSKLLQSLSDAVSPQIILISADSGISPTATQEAAIVESTDHNTIAVSSNKQTQKPRWIKTEDQPFTMDGSELGDLFIQKESSAAASRSVFKNLSMQQMNFVPGDGSHTPRWNAEHMMGRELLFFSQIYHHIDPAIAVMNLNPKQMPADYVAAHSDWTGQQEALMMLQVEAFSRRFSYLLKDLPLDQKTEGSKMWSPRGLLKQMQRHYTQHTDNVKQKMELENWPSDTSGNH